MKSNCIAQMRNDNLVGMILIVAGREKDKTQRKVIKVWEKSKVKKRMQICHFMLSKRRTHRLYFYLIC